MSEFVFTPENLIENIGKLGPWSAYGLANIALQHYFPSEYCEGEYTPVAREAELLKEINCEWWEDAVVKYHKEIGYKGPFNPDFVNER